MVMRNKPYVVTNDLEIVFPYLQRLGLASPDNEVVERAAQKIIDALGNIFPKVEVINGGRITDYLEEKISSSGLPTVSLTGLLDDKLVSAALHLSRSVMAISLQLPQYAYRDVGLRSRTGSDLSLSRQFDMAASAIRADSDKVTLIDDVVFSGGTIELIDGEFRKRGISVEKVVASVAMEDAMAKLYANGISVEADRIYAGVQDEVCMRDFIIGAPEGGRNVISQESGYASAPYLLPFGKTETWASIPPIRCTEFSRVATEASLEIWTDIDRKNGRQILAGELAKPVIGLIPDIPIVKQLEEKLEYLR